jgi:ATP-binding cassette, subfamily B, bacterial HlyB/CyaB
VQRELHRDDFLWLVGSLCQINRLPFDAALLVQRYPAPHSVRQFLEATQSLGFRNGAGKITAPALPCIAFLKGRSVKPALVLRSQGDELLYFAAGSQTPQTCGTKQAREHFESQALFIRHEKAEPLCEDGTPAQAKFGFRWFWDELLRYRPVWRDVLVASLFIQLIALATPLFTQVIIDKVVVHQTSSTLVLIAVGLAMFMFFNAGMNWLRQAHRERAGPSGTGVADPRERGADRPVEKPHRANWRRLPPATPDRASRGRGFAREGGAGTRQACAPPRAS